MWTLVQSLLVACTLQVTQPDWADFALPIVSFLQGIAIMVVHLATENAGVHVVPGCITDCAPGLVDGNLYPTFRCVVGLFVICDSVINTCKEKFKDSFKTLIHVHSFVI